MNSYTARPEHAFLSIFFVILCLLGTRWQDGKYAQAFWVGAFLCGIVFLVIVALLISDGINERVRVMSYWMDSFAKLPDDEARAAVAFEFPTMRFHMRRGMVRPLFEDTSVPIGMFKLFLQTSNAKYISPQRDWYTKEMPEWAWLEIYLWLVDHKKVVPDSAAGNTSHLWVGSSYQQLMAYWVAGNHIVDMNDMQMEAE
jgi:hypothetical protein